jgi:diaminopimelate epimerase
MASEKQLRAGDTVRIETDAGPRDCRLVRAEGPSFLFAQGMGVPTIEDKTVRLADGTEVSGFAIWTGNPQFVVFADRPNFSVHNREWRQLGHELCFHSDFPHQTNVEFARVLDNATIELRIFERGVGPTTSSGTGTCAAATASISRRGLSTHLLVRAPGGEQRIDWPSPDSEITLTGPAVLIATGEAW